MAGDVLDLASWWSRKASPTSSSRIAQETY